MKTSDLQSLDAINAAFAGPVTYAQGATVLADVPAIPMNNAGAGLFGDGGNIRQRGYEIQWADLPGLTPVNGDLITDDGQQWRVLEVINYREAAAWRLPVEEA